MNRSQKTAGTPSLLCMKAFFRFLQEMCMKDTVDHYSPKELFLLLGKASHCKSNHFESSTTFTIGQQHDMTEFLQHILDLIHDTVHFQVKIDIHGKIEGRLDQMLTESYNNSFCNPLWETIFICLRYDDRSVLYTKPNV